MLKKQQLHQIYINILLQIFSKSQKQTKKNPTVLHYWLFAEQQEQPALAPLLFFLCSHERCRLIAANKPEVFMAPLRSTSIRRGPRQICIKPDWLRERVATHSFVAGVWWSEEKCISWDCTVQGIKLLLYFSKALFFFKIHCCRWGCFLLFYGCLNQPTQVSLTFDVSCFLLGVFRRGGRACLSLVPF